MVSSGGSRTQAAQGSPQTIRRIIQVDLDELAEMDEPMMEPYVRMVVEETHGVPECGIALSRKSVLRDAQGNKMAGGALRQAVVELIDDFGNKVCIKETFALSNVMEPLLALGKMLKKGWTVAGSKFT
eukprot:s444_g59.t1